MDEAEPDMEEIKFRTTGLVQEEGKPGEAGRSRNPHDQSPSPSPPILGSRGADTQPEQNFSSMFLCQCFLSCTDNKMNVKMNEKGKVEHQTYVG
jgi:hypothetical protein